MPKTLKNSVLFIAFVSTLAVSALAADRTRVSPAWNLFSTQQDIEMGRVLADEAERTLQVVDDHNANTYIDALGRQLTAHAPGAKYPYQFKIVSDDAVNAWALPGGLIYVTTGLIKAAQTEPEFAGFLAHQIAHVALRHGTADVSQAYANRVSNAARGRVAVDDAMQQLNIRFDSNAIPLKYTREEERQADLIGAQILYDTGFDPQVMPQVMTRIVNRSNRSNGSEDWWTAHPNLPNRAAIVRTEVRNLGGLRANVRGDSGDFHSVQDRLQYATTTNWPSISDRDRRYGDRPDLPSTRTALYQGRDVEFRYPNNWRVSEDGDSLSIAPDLGIVSGSMAYGMTIAMFDPRDSQYYGRNSFSTPGTRVDTTTLARATDQLIDHLQQSNPAIRVVRNSERRRVDGEQAMVIELSNDSPSGGTETDWLVTVLRPNGMLRYFVGVAPQQEFSQYRSAFDQIVSSVRFLD